MLKLRGAHRLLATLLTFAPLASAMEGQQPTPSRNSAERLLRPAIVVVGPEANQPFGRIDCLAALPDGGVVVADGLGAEGASLWHFGPDGVLLRKLGREGRGPGEYGGYFPFGCLTVTPRGEVALHDVAGARLAVWEIGTSKTREIPLPTRLNGPPPLVVWAENGRPVVKVATRRLEGGAGFDPFAFGMLILDSTGRVLDTVRLAVPRSPVTEASGWYQPWNVSTMLPDGTRLAATTDHASVTLHPTSGPAVVVHLPWRRVSVSREERRQAQRFAEWDAQQSRGRLPVARVPSRKPFFTAIHTAPDGSIWFRLSSEGIAGAPRRLYSGPVAPNEPRETIREPWIFEVLSPRGLLVARYRLQPSGSIPLTFTAAGSTLWTVEESSDGTHRLIKWG